MAYANQTKEERKSVSTRGAVYKNTELTIPCALDVSYQDEMVRLAFTPPLPEGERGEKRLFDYNHQILTALSRQKCTELYNKYKEYIVPAIKNKEQKFISVEVGEGGANQIGISTGVNMGKDGECHPCLILIRGIDPTTKQSDNIILYEFVKGAVNVDYNPVTGEVRERITTDMELESFMEDLKSIRDAFTKAQTHSNRLVDKSYKDQVMDGIRAIMTKLGIEVNYGSGINNRNAGYSAAGLGYGNIFNSGNSNQQAKTVSSTDELSAALGGMNMPDDDYNEEGVPFN